MSQNENWQAGAEIYDSEKKNHQDCSVLGESGDHRRLHKIDCVH
jgi:hypothetical protein